MYLVFDSSSNIFHSSTLLLLVRSPKLLISIVWGENWEHCVDDLGWVSCLKSDDSARSFYLELLNGKGKCKQWSETLDSWLLCTDSITCVVRDSKVLNTEEKCTDSNCKICGSDKNICEYCSDKFILDSGSCVGNYPTFNYLDKICSVGNCIDCPDSISNICDECNKGYFVSSNQCNIIPIQSEEIVAVVTTNECPVQGKILISNDLGEFISNSSEIINQCNGKNLRFKM